MNNNNITKTLNNKKTNMFFSMLEKNINTVAKILVLFSLGFYLLSTIFLWQYNFEFGMKVCGVLLFAFMLVFAYIASSTIRSDSAAITLLFLISIAVLGCWNFICDAQPVSDYEVLINGANSIINGEFSSMAQQKDNYFYFYNFQIGYSFYLSIFLRLFRGSLVAMKILEILIIAVSNVVVYKIVRLYFSHKESFFTAVLMAVNPYIFMGSGIINNQHISCLLCLLAIYIFLSSKKLVNYVFCGVLLAFSQVLRPTTTVILAAFIICGVLYGFFKKERKILLGSVIVLVSYFAVFNLINLIFIFSDLAPVGIKNSNPYFKLLLGLTGYGLTGQPTTDANHTQLYYDLQTFNFDYDMYKDAAKEYLKTLVVEGRLNLKWIIKKMIYFSGGVDNQYSFANEEFNRNHTFLIGTINVAGTVLYLVSVLFSFIQAFKEKKTVRNKPYMLWVLIFGLFFFAYLLFETQTRYRYEQYYMLFFLAMPLFYQAIEKLLHKFE